MPYRPTYPVPYQQGVDYKNTQYKVDETEGGLVFSCVVDKYDYIGKAIFTLYNSQQGDKIIDVTNMLIPNTSSNIKTINRYNSTRQTRTLQKTTSSPTSFEILNPLTSNITLYNTGEVPVNVSINSGEQFVLEGQTSLDTFILLETTNISVSSGTFFKVEYTPTFIEERTSLPVSEYDSVFPVAGGRGQESVISIFVPYEYVSSSLATQTNYYWNIELTSYKYLDFLGTRVVGQENQLVSAVLNTPIREYIDDPEQGVGYIAYLSNNSVIGTDDNQWLYWDRFRMRILETKKMSEETSNIFFTHEDFIISGTKDTKTIQLSGTSSIKNPSYYSALVKDWITWPDNVIDYTELYISVASVDRYKIVSVTHEENIIGETRSETLQINVETNLVSDYDDETYSFERSVSANWCMPSAGDLFADARTSLIPGVNYLIKTSSVTSEAYPFAVNLLSAVTLSNQGSETPTVLEHGFNKLRTCVYTGNPQKELDLYITAQIQSSLDKLEYYYWELGPVTNWELSPDTNAQTQVSGSSPEIEFDVLYRSDNIYSSNVELDFDQLLTQGTYAVKLTIINSYKQTIEHTVMFYSEIPVTNLQTQATVIPNKANKGILLDWNVFSEIVGQPSSSDGYDLVKLDNTQVDGCYIKPNEHVEYSRDSRGGLLDVKSDQSIVFRFKRGTIKNNTKICQLYSQNNNQLIFELKYEFVVPEDGSVYDRTNERFVVTNAVGEQSIYMCSPYKFDFDGDPEKEPIFTEYEDTFNIDKLHLLDTSDSYFNVNQSQFIYVEPDVDDWFTVFVDLSDSPMLGEAAQGWFTIYSQRFFEQYNTLESYICSDNLKLPKTLTDKEKSVGKIILYGEAYYNYLGVYTAFSFAGETGESAWRSDYLLPQGTAALNFDSVGIFPSHTYYMLINFDKSLNSSTHGSLGAFTGIKIFKNEVNDDKQHLIYSFIGEKDEPIDVWSLYDYAVAPEHKYQYLFVFAYRDENDIVRFSSPQNPLYLTCTGEIKAQFYTEVLWSTVGLINTSQEFNVRNSYDSENTFQVDSENKFFFNYNIVNGGHTIVTDKTTYTGLSRFVKIGLTDLNYKTGTYTVLLGGLSGGIYEDNIAIAEQLQELANKNSVKILIDKRGHILPVDFTIKNFEYQDDVIPPIISVSFDWTQVNYGTDVVLVEPIVYDPDEEEQKNLFIKNNSWIGEYLNIQANRIEDISWNITNAISSNRQDCFILDGYTNLGDVQSTVFYTKAGVPISTILNQDLPFYDLQLGENVIEVEKLIDGELGADGHVFAGSATIEIKTSTPDLDTIYEVGIQKGVEDTVLTSASASSDGGPVVSVDELGIVIEEDENVYTIRISEESEHDIFSTGIQQIQVYSVPDKTLFGTLTKDNLSLTFTLADKTSSVIEGFVGVPIANSSTDLVGDLPPYKNLYRFSVPLYVGAEASVYEPKSEIKHLIPANTPTKIQLLSGVNTFYIEGNESMDMELIVTNLQTLETYKAPFVQIEQSASVSDFKTSDFILVEGGEQYVFNDYYDLGYNGSTCFYDRNYNLLYSVPNKHNRNPRIYNSAEYPLSVQEQKLDKRQSVIVPSEEEGKIVKYLRTCFNKYRPSETLINIVKNIKLQKVEDNRRAICLPDNAISFRFSYDVADSDSLSITKIIKKGVVS